MRVRALIFRVIDWGMVAVFKAHADGNPCAHHTCVRCAERADLEHRLEEAEQLAESRRLLLTAFDKNARRIESGKSN